jgi:hypothetical protein
MLLVAAMSQGFAQPVPLVQWSAVVKSADAGNGGGDASLELSAVVPEGWHVYAATQLPGGPTPLRVSLEDGANARLTGVASGTVPQKRHDKSFDLDTEFFTGAFTLRLPLVWLASRTAAPLLPVEVRYQTCSERECQPPQTVHLAAPTNAAVPK